MFDAEGSFENDTCPQCGSNDTVTFRFEEGFSELECRECGYCSEHEELFELQRFSGDLLEADKELRPQVPFKAMKA